MACRHHPPTDEHFDLCGSLENAFLRLFCFVWALYFNVLDRVRIRNISARFRDGKASASPSHSCTYTDYTQTY